MRHGQIRLAALIGMVMLVAVTAPAAWAAPANDTWREATRVRIGTTVHQDTTGARAEALDTRVNRACGAPFVKASVWFKYRGQTTRRVHLDTTRSSYSVGLMVFRGRPSAESLLTCGPGELMFRARADVRYHVMVFSDTRTNGGDLEMSVTRLVRPTIDLTLDDTATVDESGVLHLGMTVRCTNASYLGVEGLVSQPVGRFTVNGWFGDEAEVTCDGSDERVSMVASPQNGSFSGGKATVSLWAYVCGASCAGFEVEDHVVSLRRGSGG